jgi:integrase
MLGAAEVEAFLTDLAVARQVAGPTQNQAKSALLFLYKEVLGIELPWLEQVESAKPSVRMPVVLTPDEVVRVLDRLRGVHALIGRLLYGTGMRVMEGMRLRVKDVDFDRREILIRDGKGRKDRVTVLPRSIVPRLRKQLDLAHALHEKDLVAG